METSNIDIFATKGAEYIFVVCFLLLLIFFWRFLYPSGKRDRELSGESHAGGSFRSLDEENDECSQPGHARSSKEHPPDNERSRSNAPNSV